MRTIEVLRSISTPLFEIMPAPEVVCSLILFGSLGMIFIFGFTACASAALLVPGAKFT